MAWWHLVKNFLDKFIFHRFDDNNGWKNSGLNVALKKEAVDWLYFWLGNFTNLYLAVLALVFITHSPGEWKILTSLLDSLQEPYLGAVGIYTVLKEIRKRKEGEVAVSRHWGEFFVFLWALFLFISTIMVAFTSAYHFDLVYKLIVTNSLATMLIYLAGVLNKP